MGMELSGIVDALLGTILVLVFSTLVQFRTMSKSLSLGVLVLGLGSLFLGVLRFRSEGIIPVVSDEAYYLAWGAEIAEALGGEGHYSGRQIWPAKGVWPVVIALTHLLVENAVLVPLALATIASVLAILVLHRATHLMIGYTNPAVLAFLILLQPAFLGWGPTLNREALFWLGTALLVFGFAHYTRESYVKAIASGTVGAVFVIGVRYEVGIPLAYLILCAALIYFVSQPPKATSGGRFHKWLIASAVWSLSTLGTAFGFLWARNPALYSPIPRASEAEFQPVGSEVIKLYQRNERNRSWLGRDEVTTAFQVSENPIWGFIEGAFRTVFGPFPSEITPTLVWFTLALSTLNFLIVLSLATVFLLSLKSRFFEYSGLALAALGCIVIIVFAITNYGMVMRFRFVSQILLTPLSIGGYLVLRKKFLDFRR